MEDTKATSATVEAAKQAMETATATSATTATPTTTGMKVKGYDYDEHGVFCHTRGAKQAGGVCFGCGHDFACKCTWKYRPTMCVFIPVKVVTAARLTCDGLVSTGYVDVTVQTNEATPYLYEYVAEALG